MYKILIGALGVLSIVAWGLTFVLYVQKIDAIIKEKGKIVKDGRVTLIAIGVIALLYLMGSAPWLVTEFGKYRQ